MRTRIKTIRRSQPLLFRIPYAIGGQAVLPEQALPAKLTLNPDLRMNDD